MATINIYIIITHSYKSFLHSYRPQMTTTICWTCSHSLSLTNYFAQLCYKSWEWNSQKVKCLLKWSLKSVLTIFIDIYHLYFVPIHKLVKLVQNRKSHNNIYTVTVTPAKVKLIKSKFKLGMHHNMQTYILNTYFHIICNNAC